MILTEGGDFHLPIIARFLSAKDVVSCALTCRQSFYALGGPEGLFIPHIGQGPPQGTHRIREDHVISFANPEHSYAHATSFFWTIDVSSLEEAVDDDGCMSITFTLLTPSTSLRLSLVLYPDGSMLCSKENHISLYLRAHQPCFLTFRLIGGMELCGNTKVFVHRFNGSESDIWGEATYGPQPKDEVRWIMGVEILEAPARFHVLPPQMLQECEQACWCVEDVDRKRRWPGAWFLSEPLKCPWNADLQMVLSLRPFQLYVKAPPGSSVPNLTIAISDAQGASIEFSLPAHTFSLREGFLGCCSLTFPCASDMRISIRPGPESLPASIGKLDTLPFFYDE